MFDSPTHATAAWGEILLLVITNLRISQIWIFLIFELENATRQWSLLIVPLLSQPCVNSLLFFWNTWQTTFYFLYLIYFAFLAVSGFLQIENENYLISQELDTAVLKAFLVFIAFTNMRTKAKETKVNIKDVFQRTLKLFVLD